MAVFSNTAKTASPTFIAILRHGAAARLLELENTRFTDIIFADGTELRNATFAQLVELAWANTAKSADPSFSNTTRQ